MRRHPSDQNILLLAHGELSAKRSLPLRTHLRHCPHCRARYAELTRTSAALATALRGPQAEQWRPVPGETFIQMFDVSFLIAALAIAVLLAGFLGGTWYFAAHSHPAHPAPTNRAQAPTSNGCVPNLPGDRCR